MRMLFLDAETKVYFIVSSAEQGGESAYMFSTVPKSPTSRCNLHDRRAVTALVH